MKIGVDSTETAPTTAPGRPKSARAERQRALLVVAGLVTSSLWVGYAADSRWITALLLSAEPLLMLVLVILTYVALVRGQRLRAASWFVGGALSVVCARLPWPATEGVPEPEEVPPWFSGVVACGRSVLWPNDAVRILQWRVEDIADVPLVEDLAERLRPDILVLFGVESTALIERIHEALGGEYHYKERTAEDPSVLVLSRSVFHYCNGENAEWRRDTGVSSFAVVGVTAETWVPLLVVHYPGPLQTTDLNRRLTEASQADAWLLGQFASPASVVLADVPAPSTWRHLNNRMAAAGFRMLPVPPTWPAHVGSLRFPPVHPFDRVWAGSAWTLAEAVAVPLERGERAPLLLTLEPARRTAGR